MPHSSQPYICTEVKRQDNLSRVEAILVTRIHFAIFYFPRFSSIKMPALVRFTPEKWGRTSKIMASPRRCRILPVLTLVLVVYTAFVISPVSCVNRATRAGMEDYRFCNKCTKINRKPALQTCMGLLKWYSKRQSTGRLKFVYRSIIC